MIEGLHIRIVRFSDANLLLRWENNPSIWEITGTKEKYSFQNILDFIAQSQNLADFGQQRFIIENQENDAIGTMDLYNYNSTEKSAFVGILINEEGDRGKGFGQKALLLLEDELKLKHKIKILKCEVQRKNTGSIYLFTKLNYVMKNETDELFFFEKKLS